MKIKYIGNTPMEGIAIIYYIPSAYLNLTPASLLGHSSSCIDIATGKQFERVSLWSILFNHNAQEISD